MNEKVKQAFEILKEFLRMTDDDENPTNAFYHEEELNVIENALDDFDRYYESQQDLIKGKDEYIAKLCNDRTELKAELKELREFASLMAETLDLDEEENQVQCNTSYLFNIKAFKLVKKVVERYGKKKIKDLTLKELNEKYRKGRYC